MTISLPGGSSRPCSRPASSSAMVLAQTVWPSKAWHAERPVGQDAVEVVAGEGLAGDLIGRLHPVDDRVVRVGGRPGAHGGDQAVEPVHAVELQAGKDGAADEHVHVRFDEAGQDARPRRVDDAGMRRP